MSWTDKRVERLRELHANGCTARQIATDLGGVSRSAVIGKLHRIGLFAHPNAKNRGGRIGGLKTSKNRPAFQKPISPVRAILCDGLPIPAPAETDIARIATVDLEIHHCRFPCVPDVRGLPMGAPIFCGADKVDGLQYCHVHAKRAYALVRPRSPSQVPALPAKVLEVA